MVHLIVLILFVIHIDVGLANDQYVDRGAVSGTSEFFDGYQTDVPKDIWFRMSPIVTESYTIEPLSVFRLFSVWCYLLIYNPDGQRVDVARTNRCVQGDIKSAVKIGMDNSIIYNWVDGNCYKRSYEILSDNTITALTVKKSPFTKVDCPNLLEREKGATTNIVDAVTLPGNETFIHSTLNRDYNSRYSLVRDVVAGHFHIFCVNDRLSRDSGQSLSVGIKYSSGMDYFIDRFQVSTCDERSLKQSFILEEIHSYYVIVFKDTNGNCYSRIYTAHFPQWPTTDPLRYTCVAATKVDRVRSEKVECSEYFE